MTQFIHDQKVADAKKKYLAGILPLDEYEKIVAQADYDLAKSELFKKVQAGEMTNYAYIQWKKQNNPAKKASGGAVSAPATPKAQTPAPAPAGGSVVTANAGANAADQAAAKLEKELKKVYKQAADELLKELQQWGNDFAEKNAKKQQDLADGKITQAQYDAWVAGQAKTSELLQAQIEQMTDTMLNANQKAMGMLNGQTVGVFAENANFQSFQITKDAKVNLSFAVYDEDTVRRLILEKPELIPRKIVNGKKDKAWNQKKIAAAVTQGVLQGESIPKLAKRIAQETAGTNMNAMIRYARTAMTAAQNSGRMEMLHRAQDMGIKVKKKWLATLDSRTRDSHARLDGETVGIDEKFSNGLLYPGDPNGKPGEVWNCRCTLVYEYEDFPEDPTNDPRIQYDEVYDDKGNLISRQSSLITNMNYDEWKAAKQGGALNDLNQAKQELAEAQKAFVKAKIDESKVYADIWKDPVTLADYPAKAASIGAKRDYYTAEIDKLNTAIANGESWAKPEKVKELEKKRKLLNEFEQKGQLLQKRNDALAKVQGIYSQVGFNKAAAAPHVSLQKAPKKAKTAAAASGGASAGTAAPAGTASATAAKNGQFAPDAWDAKTKKAATLYAKRSDADKELRPELDAEWDNLTDAEKYSVWEYTRNSNPMNKSLSGYHESWDRSYFIGYDKTEWGHEDKYRTISTPDFRKFASRDGHVQYKKAITDLTNAIEKSVFKKGRWLVRGSDQSGIAGMLEGAGMNFRQAKALFDGYTPLADIKKALIGKQARNHAFTSTGIAKDAGFSGNIKYRIYCPAGTKGVYAEPQSYYGSTSSEHMYKKGKYYSSVGSEAEVILQRGTTFVIRDIKQTGSGGYEIEMEVVEQPDYFRHGDEDTYNGGKTRHAR